MNRQTAEALIRLNQQFYSDFASEFSETRQRLQPGVLRLLEQIKSEAAVLDLGCGNGELGLTLAAAGHRGQYVGLDFSSLLLETARRRLPHDYNFQLHQADLGSEVWDAKLAPSSFEVATAFAVLHHLPGEPLRRTFLQKIHRLLKPAGRLMLSNWQFLASERLRRRILPWEVVEIPEEAVDPADFLLDWRRGGRGVRYVHHFSAAELRQLAEENAFSVQEQFYSDGQGGRLGLYQVWLKQPG